MEPKTEAEIREYLWGSLTGKVRQEVIDQIAAEWIEDRIMATEWVMEGNSIIQ